MNQILNPVLAPLPCALLYKFTETDSTQESVCVCGYVSRHVCVCVCVCVQTYICVCVDMVKVDIDIHIFV